MDPSEARQRLAHERGELLGGPAERALGMSANPEDEPSTDASTADGSDAQRKDIDAGRRKAGGERDVIDVIGQVDGEDRSTGGRTWREPLREQPTELCDDEVAASPGGLFESPHVACPVSLRDEVGERRLQGMRR